MQNKCFQSWKYKIAPCIVEYRGSIDKVRKEASWIAKDIMDRINTVSLSYVLQASFLLLERKKRHFCWFINMRLSIVLKDQLD